MKEFRQCILVALLSISIISFAQGSRDSTWQLNLGLKVSRELYKLYTYDEFHLSNKLSYSIYADVRVTKFVGKKNRLGFYVDPMFGVSRVSFNAVIPNTDFGNLADSVSNASYNNPNINGWNFFRDGKLLPAESFTYKNDYWIASSKFGITYKWSRWLETAIHFGAIHFSFYNKNYVNFNLAMASSSLTGTQLIHVDIINIYEKKYTRMFAGTDVFIRLNKRISLSASASIRFNNDNYVMFLNDGGGITKRGSYPSLSLGFNYN